MSNEYNVYKNAALIYIYLEYDIDLLYLYNL